MVFREREDSDAVLPQAGCLSLHDALPISRAVRLAQLSRSALPSRRCASSVTSCSISALRSEEHTSELQSPDHIVCRRLLGKKKWFLENEKTVTQFCRKLAAERPLKDIRDE